MPTITAALAWFDEQPETLARCVRSLDGVADNLLAVDGRWDLFDAPMNISPLDQAEAIHGAAAEIGLTVREETCSANRPWPSQAAKRDYMLRTAATMGDWVFYIDADEHVTEAERATLHAALAETSLDVATVLMRNYGRSYFTRPKRRLFRSAAGLSVAVHVAHNAVRAGNRWLAGNRSYVTLDEALDLTSALTLAHDVDAHDRGPDSPKTRYYERRSRQKVETWAVAA